MYPPQTVKVSNDCWCRQTPHRKKNIFPIVDEHAAKFTFLDGVELSLHRLCSTFACTYLVVPPPPLDCFSCSSITVSVHPPNAKTIFSIVVESADKHALGLNFLSMPPPIDLKFCVHIAPDMPPKLDYRSTLSLTPFTPPPSSKHASPTTFVIR